MWFENVGTCRNNVDIRGETLIVNGKGSKERTIYLNQSCIATLIGWLDVRKEVKGNALFITNRDMRFTSKGVEYLINKYLKLAGLDGKGIHNAQVATYSCYTNVSKWC